jgi:hypothetical protein
VKEFDIHLEGIWHFNSLILANSREEAVKEALKVMNREPGTLLDLTTKNYWLEGEEGELKRKYLYGSYGSNVINFS